MSRIGWSLLPVAALVVMAPSTSSAACPYAAEIYSPNWIRSHQSKQVCLDEGLVRLAGDKSRLNGVMRLADGSIKQFSIVDSVYGRVRVSALINAYPQQSPELDQIAAYYHTKWVYERIAALGLGDTHLPDNIEIDVHGDHTNAYYKPEQHKITLGYHINAKDGQRYWYAADGEVVMHEVGHAIVHQVQPDIMTVQGSSIHEAYADYIASSMNGDICVGEYASFIHDELNPVDVPHRWSCTRTMDDDTGGRPRAQRAYRYHHSGTRQGEFDIHRTSEAVSGVAFDFRQRLKNMGKQDDADKAFLYALLLIHVDVVSDDDDGVPLHPHFDDWWQAYGDARQLLFGAHQYLDLLRRAGYKADFSTNHKSTSVRDNAIGCGSSAAIV
ncbi:MAG: hypothetical protein AAFN74_27615 [Myxococcota bacterium]